MPTFSLRARYARRIPDPIVRESERHVLLCPVEDIPHGMPLEQSNVRPQNTNKRIYKDVAKHLRNENDDGAKNTFHLKNKGITILAEKVVRTEDDDQIDIVFSSDSQGIVDGGHTYSIICENQESIRQKNKLLAEDDTLSDSERAGLLTQQFVKIEVLTGLSSSLTTEIARGLNTAVQVQEQTLANHAGHFKWIKDDLANEPYIGKIAFRENEDCVLDVMDVLCILELFNIFDYPNDGMSRHPIRAYTGKENVLATYLKQKPANLLRLRPLLKDILFFHDTVSFEARKLWNNSAPKRKAASLAFIDTARENRRPFEFPFIGKTGDCRVFKGALIPMIGAFRWMVVEDDKTGNAKWRTSFDDTIHMWRELAGKLMEATKDTSDELGRKPDAVGKSSNHWKNLYNVVAFHQMNTMHKNS